MPPTGNRDDPLRSHHFLVEIDGVASANFSECSGLCIEVAVVEYRSGAEGASVRQLPGLTKYSNIVLKRGYTKDNSLWQWFKQVLDGKTQRATGSITLLDEARQPALRWNFREAWPCKYEGPLFNAKANEVAIETLELSIEGVELEGV